MRQRLIQACVLFFILFSKTVLGGNLNNFPGVFGSFEALLQWVEENNGVLPIKTQVVVYDSTTKFVAIMHDKGFGVRAIDAYIYVCTPIRCGIFAMRATGSGDLNVVLSKGKQELILRSAKGDIYLRMPLVK